MCKFDMYCVCTSASQCFYDWALSVLSVLCSQAGNYINIFPENENLIFNHKMYADKLGD